MGVVLQWLMKTFKYWDNKKSAHAELVFECDAEGILQADVKLEEATGFIAAKCPWIGCEILPIKNQGEHLLQLIEEVFPK